MLSTLPFESRSRWGGRLGRLFSIFPTREREVVRLQLERYLPKSAKKISIADIYCNLGTVVGESMNLSPILPAINSYVSGPPKEYFDSLLARKKPIVLLSAHVSNWDLLAAYGIVNGLKLSTVGRKARNPYLQSFLEDSRARYGIQTAWREEIGSPRELLKFLRDGLAIAALIDQDLSVGSSDSTFFGQPVKAPDGIIRIAQKTEAILLSGFLVRESNLKYRIIIEELDSSLPVDKILAKYHTQLESVIAQYPDQWVWLHKRWRTRTDGTRMSTKEYLEFLKS